VKRTLLLFALLLTGCGTEGGSSVKALFSIPEPGVELEEGFFALPYPNDLRILPSGNIDLAGLPRDNAILEDYMDAIAVGQKGFGLASALYFRFDGAIAASTLPPSPADSLSEEASVYLINVDTESPDFGKRVPLEFRFQVEANSSIGENWLACLPYPGFLMNEETTYALVATNRLLSSDDEPVQASDDFAMLLEDSGPERARTLYQPLLAYLDMPGGDERGDVISAAVFTTQNTTGLLDSIRRVIYRDVPEPVARNITHLCERNGYALYEGRFDSPHFQKGVHPYKSVANGGDIPVDLVSGEPILQSMNDLRFSLSVPNDVAMPAEGWPIVLYAHGTEGDYRTYERNGTASLLASRGMAVISIDQVLHGDRLDVGSSGPLFFNFLNPLAARANVIQAALEDFQLTRLAESFDFVDAAQGNREIRFDESKMAFFGHSQGSITGVPFAALEPKMKGAVFSGAGGLLYLSMLSKTQPIDIPAVVELIIRDQPLDRFHPLLAFLQAFFEPSDAAAYAKLLVQAPPPNHQAKNVFLSLGITDQYTPVSSIKALATAIGSDPVLPLIEPMEGLALLGKTGLTPPIMANQEGVTSIVAQYQQAPGSDGHFVLFDVPEAQLQSREFLGSLFDTGVATFIAP
jgi:predicted esterase